MSFITVKKQEVTCTSVKVIIRGVDNFIEREEIDALLKQDQGELVGRRLTSINIHAIEQSLKANPYIAFAKVYTDMDGIIRITVKQRQPVLRVLNTAGQDYYIDSDGFKMPMSANFTADVLVATGSITEGFAGRIDTLRSALGRDLYRTALFMKKDTLWDAQIEQIFVTDKSDIELIPRVGNQRIVLGTADSLASKMRNLLAFYKQAMPLVGWNAYKTINLKFVNQIVCEKYDSLTIKKALAEVKTDSAVVTRPNDSVVQRAIRDEIKKAIEVGEAQAPKKVETKPPAPIKTEVREKAPEKKTDNKVVPVPQKVTAQKPAASSVKPEGSATKKAATSTVDTKAKQESSTKKKTDTRNRR